MLAPEIFFGISILFGIHVLINSLGNKTLPALSLGFHIFFFVVGLILIIVPGYLISGGVLSLSAALFCIAFVGGIIFVFEDAFNDKRPSKLLGVGYMACSIVGLLLLLAR